MRKLLTEFVPCTDEVGRLQRGGDAECELFVGFCDEAHYADRRNPDGSRTSRQGVYAVTPDGELLGAVNTQDPATMRRVLRDALAAWRKLPKARRHPDPELVAALRAVQRPEARRPDGGLTLRVTVRDLPRDETPPGWVGSAWNQDFAWLSASEARAFVPEQPEKGDVHAVPRETIARLARLQLVDTVRGQSPRYDEESVEHAELTSTVRARDGDRVEVSLRGATRTAQTGRWLVGGREDETATDQQRGVALELLGTATYDLGTDRMVALEIVALGERWGGTRFNVRAQELGAHGIGFVIALDAGEEGCEVAPASFWEYPAGERPAELGIDPAPDSEAKAQR